MTTHNGDNSSELIRTLAELPSDVLSGLQQLPGEFLNRLTQLPEETLDNLLHLPIDILKQLAPLPLSVLEWLGQLCGKAGATIKPETLIQFTKLASESSDALDKLKSLPVDSVQAMLTLPPEVVSGLATLPPELLKLLPSALSTTMETVDEIPEELRSDLSATIDQLPPESIATLSSLPSESLASLAALSPEALDAVSKLSPGLSTTLSEIPTDVLSTAMGLSHDSIQTVSELDPSIFEAMQAAVHAKARAEKPIVAREVFLKLGRANDQGGKILGRLFSEARSMRDLLNEAADQDGEDEGRATVDEVVVNPVCAEGSDDSTADKPLADADASDDASDDDSYGATMQSDDGDWSEGLSALGGEASDRSNRAGMESADFSQVIDPEGVSDDGDDIGATIQSDDLSADENGRTMFADDLAGDASGDASGTDPRATMADSPGNTAASLKDKMFDSDEDSYGATIQSDESFGKGISAFDNQDNGRTIQSSDFGPVGSKPGQSSNDDDSYGATIQSDDGWSGAGEGLSALERGSSNNRAGSDDDSFGATIQSDDGSLVPPDDDDSYGATIQSDEGMALVSSGVEDEGDSYGATMQSDDGSMQMSAEDSYSQTVQSQELSADDGEDSFAKTLASAELGPQARKNMEDAWGPGFDKDARPGMTIKAGDIKKMATPKQTLVITERAFSTKNISDYNTGGPRPPEPQNPEYELVKVLGEGGMGIVFTARQRSIDREVALKMLKPKTAKDKEQRAKFLTEAVVTGELDHPNIVPIYDVGASPDNALFYAMKKVQGIPWLKVVNEKSVTENLEILMRCADAVAFAHSRGVIHRDLKPENVMLGDYGEVLVMDWGLAYSTKDFSKSASITASTSMGGTPAYMAPEMATGPISKVGPHSDVYLLGAMLFEIVTGKPPHAGKNAMKCLMAAARNDIRDADPEKLKRTDPTGELLQIALRSMATEKELRYGTVQEFQKAIRDYQSHTESVSLSARATEDLEVAKKSDDYQDYSKALFAFQEAFEMWSGNRTAEKGIGTVKLAYAGSAERKGDFDLGMSLLDVKVPEQKTIYDRLKAAAHEREARKAKIERQKKTLRNGAIALFVVMAVAGGWITVERNEAVKQRLAAEENFKEAKKQEKLAKDNLEEAQRQEKLAKEQEALAKISEAEAVKQKGIAVEQQKLAEKNAEEAKRQEIIAKTNEKEALKQKMIADEQKLVAEMSAEEAKKQKEKAEASFKEAEKQRLIAEANEKEAKKQEMEAVKQKGLAQTNEKKAVEQQKLAEKNAEEARKQEKLALTNAEEAKKQEKLAKDNEKKAIANADEAKKQQTIAEANAKEALRQKGIADEQRLVAEKNEKEAIRQKSLAEYEKYVAQIGLADARIRENAFDTALGILKDCPVELRNWEWGRLMHLCSQSIGAFDNQSPVDALAIAPDSKRFVTGGWNGEAIVWNNETGHAELRLKHDGLYVHAVAWSNDGNWIATGSNDVVNGFVQLWDAKTGQRVDRRFGDGKDIGKSHTDAVLSVQFSKDGSKLLTGSYDNTARVWKTASGEQLRRLVGHSWWVWDAKFSPNEERIVTASQDGTAIVWDVETGEPGPPFTGHEGAIYSVAFSPDGASVATGGYDRRVLIWKPSDVRPYDFRRLASKDGNVVPPANFIALDGHTGAVRSVSYARDGRALISGGQDNTVRLWSAPYEEGTSGKEKHQAGGQLIKAFRGHDGAVRAVAFTNQDHDILSASHDHRIRKWDVGEYEEVRVLQGNILEGHADAILSAEFSHDGQRIVTAGRDRTARTWDTRSGRPLRIFSEGHSFLATSAAFSPDGKKLVTGAVDNTVRVWDTDSGTQQFVLENTGRAAALTISNDGQWIMTGGDDHAARIWNAETGKVERELKAHQSEVSAVAFSADNRLALTGDSRGRVILWDVATAKVLHQLSGHSRRISAVAFLPGKNRVATASADNTVAQWSIDTGKEDPLLTLKHPDSVVSMSLRPGTSQLMTACADGSVRVWDADAVKVIGTFDGDKDVTSVAVDTTGRWGMATAAEGRRIYLWPMEGIGATITPEKTVAVRGQLWSAIFGPARNGRSLLTLGGSDARLINADNGESQLTFSPTGIVASANFSPDGKKIVTGSWDFSARVWDAETSSDLLKLAGPEGHSGFVNSAVFSPDGKTVLTASDDRTAKLWDATTGKMLKTLSGHADRVRHAAFSSDGKRVLTSSSDRTARIWELETGKELAVMRGHEWTVLSAAFSDDDKLVITASEDNTARIWEAESGRQLHTLTGHTARVTSAAFGPGATRAVTASQDGSVKVWDAFTEKEVLTLDGHTREVTSVAFSPDGRSILTGSQDGRAILWLTVDWTSPKPMEPKVAVTR